MLAEGQIADWGLFVRGGAGYTIGVGTESDVLMHKMHFAPYIKARVQPMLSINEVAEVVTSIAG